MQRTALPIDQWLGGAIAAGGPLSSFPIRLTGGADRTIPPGRRGFSVSVLAAAGDDSPVLTTPSGSAVLPVGFTAAYSCDYPNDELATATITTVAGDDVMVLETWLT